MTRSALASIPNFAITYGKLLRTRNRRTPARLWFWCPFEPEVRCRPCCTI